MKIVITNLNFYQSELKNLEIKRTGRIKQVAVVGATPDLTVERSVITNINIVGQNYQ